MSTLDSTGLTIDSVTTIVNGLVADLQTIYGTDINVGSNSPDGQLINIMAQAVADLLELLLDTYNSFSVTNAYGAVLDQRVAINGIARKQGTFTTTPVTVTVNQALTLYGQDQSVQPVFTIADGAGNQFQLETTHVFSGAGSASLTFIAVAIGQVEVTANTITNFVTTVLGVTSVNNPTTSGTATGVNEETDAQLRVRHAQSFSLAATGPADSVEAALLAISDVTDAFVVENFTNATVNGVPAHSIWPIVAGGTSAEIAQAIYAKKGPGCGMLGSSSHTITRPNGTLFTALWDVAIPQPLYISFSLLWRGAVTLDNASIIASLGTMLSYKLGVSPSVGDIIQAVAQLAPTAIVLFGSNQGVSADGVTYSSAVAPTTAQKYYTVSPSNILIV